MVLLMPALLPAPPGAAHALRFSTRTTRRSPDHTVVDRAHLVVDQSGGQCDRSNDVLGDVGRNLAGLLRPRDPQPAVGIDGLGQRGQPLLQRRSRVKKATTTSR